MDYINFFTFRGSQPLVKFFWVSLQLILWALDLASLHSPNRPIHYLTPIKISQSYISSPWDPGSCSLLWQFAG